MCEALRELMKDELEKKWQEGFREGYREGYQIGFQEGILIELRNVVQNVGVTPEEAMKILGIAASERYRYLVRL